MTDAKNVDQVKCTYHSFVDGPGPCPVCSRSRLLQTGTETKHPYRHRYFRCRDCGYTFQSLDIDTRHFMEKSDREREHP